MRNNRILDAFWLKVAMLVLMTMDHLCYYLFPKELMPWHYTARVVAPVFVYLMTVGMVYTRSRERYILRLYLAGIFMALGNAVIYYVTKISVPNNIFLSLAVGASLIYCIDKRRESKNPPVWRIASIALVIASLYCEGQFMVPVMAVIFYYLRDKKPAMYLVYALFSCALFLPAFFSTGTLRPQIYMVFGVLPIMLYNGRRGLDNTFAKYLFYVFYPLHVWIIVLIKAFVPR